VASAVTYTTVVTFADGADCVTVNVTVLVPASPSVTLTSSIKSSGDPGGAVVVVVDPVVTVVVVVGGTVVVVGGAVVVVVDPVVTVVVVVGGAVVVVVIGHAPNVEQSAPVSGKMLKPLPGANVHASPLHLELLTTFPFLPGWQQTTTPDFPQTDCLAVFVICFLHEPLTPSAFNLAFTQLL
jgi:hypothetical protein